MDFRQFNKKITEHFDQCDINDTNDFNDIGKKRLYLDQKLMKTWGAGRKTILGNPLKLYDTIYAVTWGFGVKDRASGVCSYLLINEWYMMRSEIKQLYELCSSFEAQLDVWGRFVEDCKRPHLNFRYSGGVMMTKFRDNISDFTWRDDVLVKTLLGKDTKFKNIWAQMRESQAKADARRAKIEEKTKSNAKKLYTPGNARRG